MHQASIDFKSASGLLIGLILNLSTSTCNTLGEMKAGSEGPRYIFLIPNDSKVKSIQTAFCSYQDKTIVNGSH